MVGVHPWQPAQHFPSPSCLLHFGSHIPLPADKSDLSCSLEFLYSTSEHLQTWHGDVSASARSGEDKGWGAGAQAGLQLTSTCCAPESLHQPQQWLPAQPIYATLNKSGSPSQK